MLFVGICVSTSTPPHRIMRGGRAGAEGRGQRAQREREKRERELGSHAARLEFEAQQNQEIVDESAKPNNQRAANKLYIMDTT